MRDDKTVDEELFEDWLRKVRETCNESGHSCAEHFLNSGMS